MMKTGFSTTADNNSSNEIISQMMDLIQPVLEEAMVIAAQYSKACGRSVLLDQDVEYAMKYCIMHRVGVKIGSHFDDDEDEEDEDDMEIVPEDACPTFQRYSGTDPDFLKVNESYDTWNDWKPESPIQEMMKMSIDRNSVP